MNQSKATTRKPFLAPRPSSLATDLCRSGALAAINPDEAEEHPKPMINIEANTQTLFLATRPSSLATDFM